MVLTTTKYLELESWQLETIWPKEEEVKLSWLSWQITTRWLRSSTDQNQMPQQSRTITCTYHMYEFCVTILLFPVYLYTRVFLSLLKQLTESGRLNEQLLSNYIFLMCFWNICRRLQSKFISALPEQPKQTEVSDLTTQTHTRVHTHVARTRTAQESPWA